MTTFYIAEYENEKFKSVIAGTGRNKGTWDTEIKSRRTANRHKAAIKKQYPNKDFRIEEN